MDDSGGIDFKKKNTNAAAARVCPLTCGGIFWAVSGILILIAAVDRMLTGVYTGVGGVFREGVY